MFVFCVCGMFVFWVCGMFVFWVSCRVFSKGTSCRHLGVTRLAVSRWRQQIPLTCPYLSAKQHGIMSHSTVLSLKFLTTYVMLIMFLNVRFVLSDFHPLLTFLNIRHRILSYGPTELLTDRGKDSKHFPSWAGCLGVL